MNINKTKLYENFINIKNIANLKILRCYKKLFSKKGISKNIGNYILLFIITFHIISIFIFYFKQYIIIKNKINDIIYAINYSELIKQEKEKKEGENDIKDEIKKHEDIIDDNSKENKLIISSIKKYSKKRNTIIGNENQKKYIISNVITIGKDNISEKNKENKVFVGKGEKFITNRIKEIMEYNVVELNELEYDLAIQYDKRTYCIYYISLIKTKHNLIFAFFNNNDYNSNIIKIDLFFIEFGVEYTINALFYNDDLMHKIYEDKGSFDFIYQLPKTIYSSLISIVLNSILRILALSNNAIIKFKQSKDKVEVNKRGIELENILKIRFILFFIISFIFLLFFWYYISMFGAIYMNTQFHLLKDTLMSFSLSLIYPFIINLLPGIFRIPSLSDPKNKKIYLYNFSKIIQMI